MRLGRVDSRACKCRAGSCLGNPPSCRGVLGRLRIGLETFKSNPERRERRNIALQEVLNSS